MLAQFKTFAHRCIQALNRWEERTFTRANFSRLYFILFMSRGLAVYAQTENPLGAFVWGAINWGLATLGGVVVIYGGVKAILGVMATDSSKAGKGLIAFLAGFAIFGLRVIIQWGYETWWQDSAGYELYMGES